VALLGFDTSAQAFGACRDFWRNDVQMHWALARGRHGVHKMTRLMWASREGRLARVVELVAWNSDVNAQDEDGYTPLPFASWKGHLEVTRELLRRGAKLEVKDKDG
jgi:ankyrin repeat protein